MLGSHVRPSSGAPSRRRPPSHASPASARGVRSPHSRHATTDTFSSPTSFLSAESDVRLASPGGQLRPRPKSSLGRNAGGHNDLDALPPRPGSSLGQQVLTPAHLGMGPRNTSSSRPDGSGSDSNEEEIYAQWSPSEPDDGCQDQGNQLHSGDDHQEISSVVASDSVGVADGSDMPGKSSTGKLPSSRRVTFVEMPAPQGSAQAAAKFNRQRQRSHISTTLRRADRLTPRSTWTQPASPQASPRDTAALEETRSRAFPASPLSDCTELNPTSKDRRKDDADAQARAAMQKKPNLLGEEADPHTQSLPKHVKSLWSIYHPDDELNDDSHGALVQALAGGTTFDQDANLQSELQRIKTGEDAIAFFATHGDNTGVKVMYARRAEVGICEFRPYDLVLVNEKERGSEFFMISSKGVVHICPGRLSEHTTLSDWMHQTMMFSVLTSMTFFRHYIASKSLSNWRSSARHLAYSALRTRLSRRLFLAKPVFVEAQARIHSLLYSVGSTRLISLDATGRALELQPFLHHQKELCSMSDFEAKADAVTEVVDVLLDAISNAGRVEQEADRKPKKLKGRSVAAERKDAQLRVHRRRLQEFNISLLGNFVRVVDVMLLSRLVDLVVSQAAELLDRLEKTPKIFSVAVNFSAGKEHMDFFPDRKGFVLGLTEVLDQAVELVGSVAPLATSRKYDEYFRHHHVHPARAGDVVKKNYKFQATKQAIMGRVALDFAKSQKEADEYYGPYRKIFDYGLTWDQERFDARELSHPELADEMALMKRWEEELDKVKSVHVSGFLMIQARTLRDTLVPVVEGGLQMMKGRLRLLARDHCRLAYEQFDQVNRELQQRPVRLEQFAEYVRSYRWTQSRWRELDEMKNAVEEMYSMIRQYGIRVEMNEEVTKEALNQKVVMLETTSWPEATVFIDELLKPRSDEVQHRIEAIETEATIIKGEFKTGLFADVNTVDNPTKVIEKLEQIEDKLSELGQNGSWLNTCLELFLQAPMEMKSLSEAAEEHEKQVQLWETVLQWNRSTTAWLALHTKGLDIFPIRAKLEGFDKSLVEIGILLPKDRIVAELWSRVKIWEAMLPALMHLANPALGAAHWGKILEPLHVVAVPSEVTIKMLQSNGLFGSIDSQRELAAISAGASVEAGLHAVVEGVVQDWDQEDVALSCVAPDIDLWILADQSEVLDYLDSDLTSLKVVLKSPHLTDQIESHAKDWEKKLQRAKETLLLWLQVQKQYIVFALFFEDAHQWDSRSNSILAPVHDSFRPADRLWRQLLSRARTNFRTVIAVTSQGALQSQLKKLGHDLDLAESKLSDFMALQRKICPRFHLVEEHQLLQMFATAARQGVASAAAISVPRVFSHCAGLKMPERTVRVDSNPSSPRSSPRSVSVVLVAIGGEALTLKAPTEPAHLSEWLQKLEANCHQTLDDAAQSAMENAAGMGPADLLSAWLGLKTSSSAEAFPVSLPGQIVLLTLAVQWAHFVELVLLGPSSQRASSLPLVSDRDACVTIKDAFESYKAQTMQLAEILRWSPTGHCIINPVHRMVLGAALLQALRGQRVLEILAADCRHTPAVESFEWQRYLRMHWNVERKRASATLLDWSVDYGCEFVGASPRLVITPETDRNYLGLIGGLRSHAAVAVAGPSGAGKSETLREMARFLASPLLEVNGATFLDTVGIARTFRGLASLGAWGIFHISQEEGTNAVMAVFAESLRVVSEARYSGLAMLELDNHPVAIDQQRPPAVFLVLPAVGASQPPVDLARYPVSFRVLVRPLALALPSPIAVAEAFLMTEGFADESTQFARKIACFFEAFGVQPSYASCRALTSIQGVVRVSQNAGQLLRSGNFRGAGASVAEAIRSMARGHSVSDPAWELLLTDLFRESSEAVLSDDPAEKMRSQLCKRIQAQLVDHGLIVSDNLPSAFGEISEVSAPTPISQSKFCQITLKALDIHHHVCTKQAVVITGGAMSGKSGALSAVVAASQLQNEKDAEVVSESLLLTRFFPAAYSSSEWLGSHELNRHAGRPGLLTRFLQSFTSSSPLMPESSETTQTTQATSGKHHLVVLDAELDPSWADELYPALVPQAWEGAGDFERQVCLGGTSWVTVPCNMSFAFETQGLTGASPAFCARVAICSLGGNVTLLHLVEQFSEHLKASRRLSDHRVNTIMTWVRGFLDMGALAALRNVLRSQCGTKDMADQVDLEHGSRLLRMIEAMVCDAQQEGTAAPEDPHEVLELKFIYAVAWGLGGSLDEAGRKELGAFLIEKLQAPDGLSSGYALLENIVHSPENLWKFQIVFDEDGVRCLPMSDLLLGVKPLEDKPELLPTEETEAVRIVCQQLACSSQSFFLCGGRMSGKSSAAERILRHTLEIGWESLLFRCPLGVPGSTLSCFIRSELGHQPGACLGPSTGGLCTAIIDDLHLSSGSLPELLREVADLGGFRDSRDHSFYSVRHVQFGAVGLPNLLRMARNSAVAAHTGMRWLRHFQPIQLQDPGIGSLSSIYDSLLGPWFSTLTAEVQEAVATLKQSLACLTSVLLTELPLHPRRLFAACSLCDVFQFCKGISLGTPHSELMLNRLALHEARRQFQDRFSSIEDHEAFDRALGEVGIVVLQGPEPIFANIVPIGQSTIEKDSTGSAFKYTDLGGPSSACELITETLEATLRNFPLPIVVFADLVVGIVGVARALRLLAENRTGVIFVLGSPGSGKRVCGHLGAHLAHSRILRPHAIDGWGLSEELSAIAKRSDPRMAVLTHSEASGQPTPVVFGPVLDSQLDSACGGRQFLSNLDAALRGAHLLVPDPPGEDVLPRFATAGYGHLAVLMCWSPERGSDHLRDIVRAYPGLAASSGVVWLQPWSKASHAAVAESILLPKDRADVSIKEQEALLRMARASADLPDAVPCAATRHCHKAIEHAHGAEEEAVGHIDGSAMHMRFVASIVLLHERQAARHVELVQEKMQVESALGGLMGSQEVASTLANRYEAITDTIAEEEECQMKVEGLLKNMHPQLLELQQTAEEHEEQLVEIQIQVDEHKNILDAAYADALDLLNEARRDLEGLTKASILECRLVDVPSEQLAMAIWPVMILLGKPTEWNEVETFLGERDAINKIVNINPQELAPERIHQLDALVGREAWGEGLEDEAIPGVAFGRCCVRFVSAFQAAAHRWEELSPQRQTYEAHCRRLEEFEAKVEGVRASLGTLQETMREQERLVDEHKRAAAAAKEELSKLTPEAHNHQQIVEATDDEVRLWRLRRQELKDSVLHDLPGNLLLAAFLVHYAGALTTDQRNLLLHEWCDICQNHGVPVNRNASVDDMLRDLGGSSDAARIVDTVAGLCVPQSIDMSLRSLLTPLMYDPLCVVKSWLTQHIERKSDVAIMHMRTSETPAVFLDNLKTAARKHMPVIVEVTDGHLPVLLDRLLHGDGPITLGSHQLFLISRHVSPVSNTTAFFSFDLPLASLETRLVDEILKMEAPELRQRMSDARLLHAQTSAEAVDKRSKILDRCSTHMNSKTEDSEFGDAMDMDILLAEVVRLKSSAEEAEGRSRVAAAEVARAEKLAAKWHPVAEVAAALYTVLLDAEKWHCTYQCSWERFRQWFGQAFQDSAMKIGRVASGKAQEGFIAAFTRNAAVHFLESVASEFFPRHRLILAFSVAVRLAGAKRGLGFGVVAQLLDIVCADELTLSQIELPEEFELQCGICPQTIDPIVWQRLRACALVSPAFQPVLSHMQAHPDAWTWVAESHATIAYADQLDETTAGNGLQVPRVKLPALKTILPDIDDLQEAFIIASAVRRWTVPALRRYVTTELGQAAGRAVADDRVPHDQFVAAVHGMGMPRILIALTEEEPGVDSRVNLETWLTWLAREEGVPLSVLSGSANDFVERAAKAIARRQQYHGWILMLDVLQCKELPKLWDLTTSILDEQTYDTENASSFLLALSVHVSPATLAGKLPLAPCMLACASRIALAPPRGLRGRLGALLSEFSVSATGLESDEHGLGRSFSNQRAGLLWLYASMASRAAIGGAIGWSLPYVWTVADLKHALGILNLAGNTCDSSCRDLGDIASFLGFGVHVSSHADRLALESLAAECASPSGPLEVWSRIVASIDRMPVAGGMEELAAFSQAALPADDAGAYSCYLPDSCGLGKATATMIVSVQQQEAEGLLHLLHSSFWAEDPTSDGGVEASEREAEVLNRIELLHSSLTQSSERLVAFSKVKRRASRPSPTASDAAMQSGHSLVEKAQFSDTLTRELHRYCQHAALILESLAQVADVLRGKSQSSDKSFPIIESLWQDAVPAVWELAGESLDCAGMPIAVWSEEMDGRSKFLHDWCMGHRLVSFWLGGMACPRDFLTAVLQQHARSSAVEFDKLCLSTSVTAMEAPQEPWCADQGWEERVAPGRDISPREGVLVHGFALVGASWGRAQPDDFAALARAMPGMQADDAGFGICDRLQIEAPSWISLLHLIPRQIDLPPTSTNLYRCPVYRRKRRGAPPLFDLDLPSLEASDGVHWAAKMARRGVALVCELQSCGDIGRQSLSINIED